MTRLLHRHATRALRAAFAEDVERQELSLWLWQLGHDIDARSVA